MRATRKPDDRVALGDKYVPTGRATGGKSSGLIAFACDASARCRQFRRSATVPNSGRHSVGSSGRCMGCQGLCSGNWRWVELCAVGRLRHRLLRRRRREGCGGQHYRRAELLEGHRCFSHRVQDGRRITLKGGQRPLGAITPTRALEPANVL
jgi:hypothetical protein